MRVINKKNERQVNKTSDAGDHVFNQNVMNEQIENNKQTNCFLKMFIRKPLSVPLKAIRVKK